MYGIGECHPVIVKLLALVERDVSIAPRPIIAVARDLNISMCHLQHLIKRDLGISYTALVRKRRVALVRRTMRENPALTISDVAERFGYEPGQLYRHFMIELSAAPSTVRQRDSRTLSSTQNDEF